MNKTEPTTDTENNPMIARGEEGRQMGENNILGGDKRKADALWDPPFGILI